MATPDIFTFYKGFSQILFCLWVGAQVHTSHPPITLLPSGLDGALTHTQKIQKGVLVNLQLHGILHVP